MGSMDEIPSGTPQVEKTGDHQDEQYRSPSQGALEAGIDQIVGRGKSQCEE